MIELTVQEVAEVGGAINETQCIGAFTIGGGIIGGVAGGYFAGDIVNGIGFGMALGGGIGGMVCHELM
jgi:hypothetical protein